MSRYRVYPPNFAAQLRNLNTVEDVTRFMDTLIKLREEGKIPMASGTFRKLWRQAHDRCQAIKRATLYDAHGRPLV